MKLKKLIGPHLVVAFFMILFVGESIAANIDVESPPIC